MENKSLTQGQFALPPWSLTGSGYILLYHFSKKFIHTNGFLADFQKKKLHSGWGAVMLVDYQTSPVGPYYELLFIPGLFSFQKKKVFSISKIYVSTQQSVMNGAENWGIPKEQADFDWSKNSTGDLVDVSVSNHSIFQAVFSKKWLRFPITSSLLPLTILQKRRDELLVTKPKSQGTAHFAEVKNLKIDAAFFPDLSTIKPLITLKVENFKMEFPKPVIG